MTPQAPASNRGSQTEGTEVWLSRKATLLSAILMVLAETGYSVATFSTVGLGLPFLARLAHSLMCVAIVFYLLKYRTRQLKKVVRCHVGVIAPLYFVAWLNQTAIVAAGSVWWPPSATKAIVLGLGLFSFRPFWINQVFLWAFVLEFLRADSEAKERTQ